MSRASSSNQTKAPAAVEEVVLAPPMPEFDRRLYFGGAAAVVIMVLFLGFNLLYWGKAYPGIAADGVTIAGMSRQQAIAAINNRTGDYANELIPVTYDHTTVRISLANLGLRYDAAAAADAALAYGRAGSLGQRLWAQARVLLNRPTNFAVVHYDQAKLTPYLDQIGADLSSPVSNATLRFDNGTVTVVEAEAGSRLDVGLLTAQIQERLAATSVAPIRAPAYGLTPVIDTAGVRPVAKQAAKYVSGPLQLDVGGKKISVSQADIVKWIHLGRDLPRDFAQTHNVADLVAHPATVTLELDKGAIAGYVAQLAKQTDREPQDAALTIADSHASIFRPSSDGYKLDQPGAVNAISAALEKPGDQRALALKVATIKPAVNEENLNNLGIKELIAEGVTFFPGSPSTRLINVRTGASKFNGILLKPDEVFSFGKYLGAVGPAQGYVPELVILADHEEKQYGGGLCQVSSTAFRAALAAGLPILERHNHSFAVSYYTAPYGVPGVDATIYYPQIDFKFKNDTGSYILIQTVMTGTTLKFDFYGTKTKSGTIRGPKFISGSTDAKQPSRTVFWRDVLDLAGNVIKTDTFNTNYKSSNDFPITEQFN